MASKCVNRIGISSDSFLDRPTKSLTRKCVVNKDSNVCNANKHLSEEPILEEILDDFEFHLEDNFTMLPADQLFFNGKLVPLQLSMVKQGAEPPRSRVSSPKLLRKEISVMDSYLFSPKAPRCSARWKELLGLRKLYQNQKDNNYKSDYSSSTAPKSLKNFINRCSKSSISSYQPLLKDEDEYISISSSRLSLSSSSSGQEHDDSPRLSVEVGGRRSTSSDNRVGGRRRRVAGIDAAARGVSMESPRMNASGKIVFQSLERSTSSPSSYGGARYKQSSVQRSYSANVRVTPVLNVPVCSKTVTVFGLFAPKRDSFGSKGSCKTRKDRN